MKSSNYGILVVRPRAGAGAGAGPWMGVYGVEGLMPEDKRPGYIRRLIAGSLWQTGGIMIEVKIKQEIKQRVEMKKKIKDFSSK